MLTQKIDTLADLIRSLDDAQYLEPLDYVQVLRMIRDTADSALVDAVPNAIASGWTWASVARVLGVSRQSAWAKYADDVTTR